MAGPVLVGNIVRVVGVRMSMRVEIWSDVVCPWCYIGKRRFESALAEFEHADDVEVIWRSFELDPSAPPSPATAGGHTAALAKKFGTDEASVRAMFERVTAVAAGEGLDFHFELSRSGNTFDAHRLLHLAKSRGIQDQVKEAFDDATFTKGLAVSDHQEMTEVAVASGLPRADVARVLASDEFADDVRADEALAQAHGIRGVPFFAIDDRIGVSGAQESAEILAALRQAESTQVPAAVAANSGEICDGDNPQAC